MSDNPEYPSGEPVEFTVTMLHRAEPVRHVHVLDRGERFIADLDDAARILDWALEAHIWTASAERPWGLELSSSLGNDGDPSRLQSWLSEIGQLLSGDPGRFTFAPDLRMMAFDALGQVDEIRARLSDDVEYRGYNIVKLHLGAPFAAGPLEVYMPVQLEMTYR